MNRPQNLTTANTIEKSCTVTLGSKSSRKASNNSSKTPAKFLHDYGYFSDQAASQST